MIALLWLFTAPAQDAPASPEPVSEPAPVESPDAPDTPPDETPDGGESPAADPDDAGPETADPDGAAPPEDADPDEVPADEPDASDPDADTHGPEGKPDHAHEPADAHEPSSRIPSVGNPPEVFRPERTPAPAPAARGDFFGFFPDAPAPAPREVVYVNGQGDAVAGPLDAILPHPPHQGMSSFLSYGFTGVLCWALAIGFRRATGRLRSSGVLPWALGTLEVLLRIAAAAAGILAVGALVPPWLAPALPIVALSVAVAVGWSARDVVQDLVAGGLLMAEGQLRSGHWVRGERYAGTVQSIGPRVTWLRDTYGRRIVVPNRVLVSSPLVADDNPWPRIQFTVAMPFEAPSSAIRAALEEAIVVSPWVAPDPDAEVHPDSLETGHWHIAVRLLDSRYADRFQGLLRERVEEILPGRLNGKADG